MGAWKIVNTPDSKYPRMIVHSRIPRGVNPETYSYKLNTPITLAPINDTSAFILSECNDGHGNKSLKIQDLRVINGEITSSMFFRLRGSKLKIGKFKNTMNRKCDGDRCVGIMFLFRKAFYTGFNTLMCPKTLKPKINSSLESAKASIHDSMKG